MVAALLLAGLNTENVKSAKLETYELKSRHLKKDGRIIVDFLFNPVGKAFFNHRDDMLHQ